MADYNKFLHPGESLLGPEDGSVIELFEQGSRIVPITYKNGVSGQSVLIDMESTGYVRPVEIVDDEVEFTVETLAGKGTLFVQKFGENIVRRVRLRAGRNYTLGKGDIYGYVPKGDNGWIVRDDATVPFEPAMEKDIEAGTRSDKGGYVRRSIERAYHARNAHRGTNESE